MWAASTSSKITDEHRRRKALVYVRQSSPRQVEDNQESRRRQYELAELARSLGFASVGVIDDDLGRSGSGTMERPGFERLFGEVLTGGVGAVFCLETSRLSRNGRDWHALLEVCRHLGTLIVSNDGVADPRLGDDQLVLGLKGTLAEYELSLFRQRGLEARDSLAQRGEYRMLLPVGYVWTADGRIEKTPDARIRRAVELVFAKFRELGSGTQVTRWFVEEGLDLPVLRRSKGRAPDIVWRRPDRGAVVRVLKNPVNAGAYAWGRATTLCELVDGRLRKRATGQRPLSQWRVLIEKHHEGYIDWDEYLRILKTMAANNYRVSKDTRRWGRGGPSLLSGLLRCRRCGRRMSVTYSGANGAVTRYSCMSGRTTYALGTCLSFSASDLDARVAAAMLEALQPMAIDAALAAEHELAEQRAAERQVLADELAQREYEVKLAARRYEAVDPDNRLVAGTLEEAWERALAAAGEVSARLNAFDQAQRQARPVDKARLMALAGDLEGVWSSPHAAPELKQRIVALMLEEVVVDVDDERREILAKLHWRGGRHSDLRVPKRGRGKHTRRTPEGIIDLVRAAAPRWTDQQMADLLNKQGSTTGAGNPWTRERIRSLRAVHGIAPYDPQVGELYVNLSEAVRLTGASTTYLRALMDRGLLPFVQICSGAHFEILRSDLERPDVVLAIATRHEWRHRKPESRTAQGQLGLGTPDHESGATPISSSPSKKSSKSKPVVR
jgi:DNA invertase Pin-like site-specific DNA recombinase